MGEENHSNEDNMLWAHGLEGTVRRFRVLVVNGKYDEQLGGLYEFSSGHFCPACPECVGGDKEEIWR
jgi:hypothetical protein